MNGLQHSKQRVQPPNKQAWNTSVVTPNWSSSGVMPDRARRLRAGLPSKASPSCLMGRDVSSSPPVTLALGIINNTPTSWSQNAFSFICLGGNLHVFQGLAHWTGYRVLRQHWRLILNRDNTKVINDEALDNLWSPPDTISTQLFFCRQKSMVVQESTMGTSCKFNAKMVFAVGCLKNRLEARSCHHCLGFEIRAPIASPCLGLSNLTAFLPSTCLLYALSRRTSCPCKQGQSAFVAARWGETLNWW